MAQASSQWNREPASKRSDYDRYPFGYWHSITTAPVRTCSPRPRSSSFRARARSSDSPIPQSWPAGHRIAPSPPRPPGGPTVQRRGPGICRSVGTQNSRTAPHPQRTWTLTLNKSSGWLKAITFNKGFARACDTQERRRLPQARRPHSQGLHHRSDDVRPLSSTGAPITTAQSSAKLGERRALGWAVAHRYGRLAETRSVVVAPRQPVPGCSRPSSAHDRATGR